MTAEDVLAVVATIEGAGVTIWLDGGWGVDALVGVQSREHSDLDVVVELSCVPALTAAVAPLGFSLDEDHLPTRLVLRAPDGRQVDLHPVTFDAHRTGWQAAAGPDGGDCPYPADGFATGTVGGRTVGCLGARLQVDHHRGYEPSDVDRADLRLLRDTFGIALPPPYEPVSMDRPDTREIWTANAPAWIELSRAGYDVFRDLVNTPAFFEMLPPVEGLRCLDLGCGEGHNTRLLAERGADVVALDISDVFIEAAAGADPDRELSYVIGDGAVLPFRPSSFDVVTAFMSLMDVAEPERTFHEIARVLRPGGTLQFSVLHPVSSTPVRRWIKDDAGHREALAIGGYFHEGPVRESWTFSAAPLEVQARHRPFEMTYARRTVAGWFNAVTNAGFAVRALDEPNADETTAIEHPEVADTRIVPYSLIVRATRT